MLCLCDWVILHLCVFIVMMNIISGILIDGMATPDPVTGELIYDFSYVSVFWLGAAIISFLLPILNWGRKKMEI